jgi:hypothetical protein
LRRRILYIAATWAGQHVGFGFMHGGESNSSALYALLNMHMFIGNGSDGQPFGDDCVELVASRECIV